MEIVEGLEISGGIVAAIILLAVLFGFAMFVRGMRDMPPED